MDDKDKTEGKAVVVNMEELAAVADRTTDNAWDLVENLKRLGHDDDEVRRRAAVLVEAALTSWKANQLRITTVTGREQT